MQKLHHVSETNPIHELNPNLYAQILAAQGSYFPLHFNNAYEFVSKVSDQLKLTIKLPELLKDEDALEFSDKGYSDFYKYYSSILRGEGYPSQAIPNTAKGLASRTMLLRAFEKPDLAVDFVRDKVISVVESLPKTAADIEVGRNKGDVLDPFLIAATQNLLYEGEFGDAISATVSHKALMILEGLMGHLHEDVLGLMRGNTRIPEPRGEDQEKFDHFTNPFPGADMIQPPCNPGERISLHQIKSKTGSAKGGDGKRLGDQLSFLSEHYDADIYYDALVGNTLIGHRSKAGVEKAAPNVRVLVGKSAFLSLTRSSHGADLLLRLYQEAFVASAEETGYSINKVTEAIVETFSNRAEQAGETFLDVILEKSTGGTPLEQDSIPFNKAKEEKKRLSLERKKSPKR